MKADPPWLAIARAECGVKSFAPNGSNQRIEQYHQTIGKSWDDNVAWCSSFLNWCMQQAGIEGTNSALARSWLEWGQAIDEPRYGCIVVLMREESPDADASTSDNNWRGHVGIYLCTEGNKVVLWGGNQLKEVREHSYDVNSVLGYRWPNTTIKPPASPATKS